MKSESIPNWMGQVLKIAAVYNIVWGAWVILLPNHFFELVGIEPPLYTVIWQGMGMVVGVYGLGYWWASHSPIRHWPIIAVGFLGKLFGPIGFILSYSQDLIPGAFGYTLLTNDLVWWLPFILILNTVRKMGWPLRD